MLDKCFLQWLLVDSTRLRRHEAKLGELIYSINRSVLDSNVTVSIITHE